MACFGCIIPEFEDVKPLIVDVNKILCDKAWNNFKYSFGYFGRKCLKRSNFVINVPENYFDFKQIEQSITDPGRGSGINAAANAPNNNADGSGADMLQGNVPKARASNPDTITLDTHFSNDTAEKQTYQFKYSKTRTTHIEVTYQKGFTIGGKASFSIGLPKVLPDGSMGLEVDMQYQVSKSKGQSFDESMNMEATSDITVGPKSNYLANVQLEERSVHCGFQVRTRMSMPQGRAPIYIRRKSDDTVVFVYKMDNLKDAFIGEVTCAEKVIEGEQDVMDKIDFVIEGVIKGNLACDHTINLTSDESEEEKNAARRRRLHISEED